MTELAVVLPLAGFAAAGAAVGAASLAALRLNTALYFRRPLPLALTLHAFRLALLAAALLFFVREGAGPLIAATAGIGVVRPLAMRALGAWT